MSNETFITAREDLEIDMVCSGKRCRQEAVWALQWRNPKIHSEARRKVWLACDDHRDHLTEFLDLRGFLLNVLAAADMGPDDGPQ